MQVAAATGTVSALRHNHDLLARQVLRQMAPVGAAGLCGFGAQGGTVRLDLRVLDAKARLDILQRQLDLVVSDALGATPEMGTPEYRYNVIETVGLRRQTIDLGFECCVPRFETVAHVGELREAATLGGKLSLAGRALGQKHCLQACNIVREIIDCSRHAIRIADFAASRPLAKRRCGVIIVWPWDERNGAHERGASRAPRSAPRTAPATAA